MGTRANCECKKPRRLWKEWGGEFFQPTIDRKVRQFNLGRKNNIILIKKKECCFSSCIIFNKHRNLDFLKVLCGCRSHAYMSITFTGVLVQNTWPNRKPEAVLQSLMVKNLCTKALTWIRRSVIKRKTTSKRVIESYNKTSINVNTQLTCVLSLATFLFIIT